MPNELTTLTYPCAEAGREWRESCYPTLWPWLERLWQSLHQTMRTECLAMNWWGIPHHRLARRAPTLRDPSTPNCSKKAKFSLKAADLFPSDRNGPNVAPTGIAPVFRPWEGHVLTDRRWGQRSLWSRKSLKSVKSQVVLYRLLTL